MEYCRTVGTSTDAVNHPERELSFRQVVTDTFDVIDIVYRERQLWVRFL